MALQYVLILNSYDKNILSLGGRVKFPAIFMKRPPPNVLLLVFPRRGMADQKSML